ncbi:aldo/keto reductase [Paraburkholderia bengalensis]|uniref:Aldo/keto reductase n=1 Tax=Paraburkholderia bengalensis TaxID=2747562 RepID=A0ABU8IVQ0_9BURK
MIERVPPVALARDVVVSKVVAGMWRVMRWDTSREGLARFIGECVALGVTSFDLADIYGGGAAQAFFGEALAARGGSHDIQIITKAGIRLPSIDDGATRVKYYDSSATHLRRSVDNALSVLGRERIDVFLLHRPDPLLDRDELAELAQQLVAQGKIGAFGVSNFSAREFDWLGSRVPLASNQIEFSPFHTAPLDDGTLTAIDAADVVPMIWSPLGGGRLFDESDPTGTRVREVLQRIQRDRGLSDWVPLAYAWVCRLPTRPIVLTGTSRVEGIRDATYGAGITLTREEWFNILEAARGYSVA